MRKDENDKRYQRVCEIIYGSNTSRRKGGRFLSKLEREQVVMRSYLTAIKCRIVFLGGANLLFPEVKKRPTRYFANKKEIHLLHNEYRDLLEVYGDSKKAPNTCNCSPYYLAKVYKTSPAVIWGIIKRWARTGSVTVKGDVQGIQGVTQAKPATRYHRRQARILAKRKRQAVKPALRHTPCDQKENERPLGLVSLTKPISVASQQVTNQIVKPLTNPDQDAHKNAYDWTASQLVKRGVNSRTRVVKVLNSIVRHYRDTVGTDDDCPKPAAGLLDKQINLLEGQISAVEFERNCIAARLKYDPELMVKVPITKDEFTLVKASDRLALLTRAIQSFRTSLDRLYNANIGLATETVKSAIKPAKTIRKNQLKSNKKSKKQVDKEEMSIVLSLCTA